MKEFFYVLNTLIPKHQRQVCINSFPDYDDMMRGLLDSLTITGNKYKIVILTCNKTKPPKWAQAPNITHLKKKSMMGMWARSEERREGKECRSRW